MALQRQSVNCRLLVPSSTPLEHQTEICQFTSNGRAAIAAKKNVLTAGSTGSEKTIFTNAFLDGTAGFRRMIG
jgi:type IV secretory pathway ATPase VirB11/archaellum biosynthesis ATPase